MSLQISKGYSKIINQSRTIAKWPLTIEPLSTNETRQSFVHSSLFPSGMRQPILGQRRIDSKMDSVCFSGPSKRLFPFIAAFHRRVAHSETHLSVLFVMSLFANWQTIDRKVAETFICETVVLSNRIISTELCQNTSCIHNILWVFLFGSISNVAVSSRDFNIIPSTILVRA